MFVFFSFFNCVRHMIKKIQDVLSLSVSFLVECTSSLHHLNTIRRITILLIGAVPSRLHQVTCDGKQIYLLPKVKAISTLQPSLIFLKNRFNQSYILQKHYFQSTAVWECQNTKVYKKHSIIHITKCVLLCVSLYWFHRFFLKLDNLGNIK